MRSGKDYLASIADDRAVYVDGQRVRDVPVHPAFAPVATTIAELFDLASEHSSSMTATSSETGGPINRVYRIPRSRDDLTAFRNAVQTWARHTHGWVGRGPDHVASFFNGFAAHPEVFAAGARDFAANVLAFHRRLQAESLYVTYAIIPPQVSRATTAHGLGRRVLQVGVVSEGSGGHRGARRADARHRRRRSPTSSWCRCITPLTDNDARLSPSASSYPSPPRASSSTAAVRTRPPTPAATTIRSRRASTRPTPWWCFDDVFVPVGARLRLPRHRGAAPQFFETGAHVLGNTQAQIRLAVKMEFLVGLARKIAAVNGDRHVPRRQEKLGELACLAARRRGHGPRRRVHRAPDADGVVAARTALPLRRHGPAGGALPARPVILRELAGGGVIQVPSASRTCATPRPGPTSSATSRRPGMPAEERIKLFKLAWDLSAPSSAGATTSTRCSTPAPRTSPRATRSGTTATRRRSPSSTSSWRATAPNNSASISRCSASASARSAAITGRRGPVDQPDRHPAAGLRGRAHPGRAGAAGDQPTG